MAPAKPLNTAKLSQAQLWSALLPWIIVCAVMLIWGSGAFKTWANSIFVWKYQVPELHNLINKVPPVAAKPTPEAALFDFTYLSFTGTGMLIAAIISGFLMGFSPLKMVAEYGRTIRLCAISLITISAMLAIGTLTRLSGVDATLGLAFAATGVLYPFFGTLLGWLGVALTGSDTASNVLFGNLQKITAEQLGLSPDADGRRQLLRRRHGQDDRRAIHRRRLDRDQLVRPRRHDPALRLPAFDRAGLPRRRAGDAAGLRLSVHDDGAEIGTPATATDMTPAWSTLAGVFLSVSHL